VIHAVVLILAAGYGLALILDRPPLASMIAGTLLDTPNRHALLLSMLVWTLLVAFGFTGLLAVTARLRPGEDRTRALARLTSIWWPVTLLPLAAYAFDRDVWPEAPIILYCIALVVCGYCAYWARRPEWLGRLARSAREWTAGPAVLLAAITATYVVYVSLHTIRHHYSLGTSAYDLGIHENFLWNTIHGEFFQSSIEGGSHLGVHTSLVILLIAPLYALAPATETLLVIQAVLIGGAAWPLYETVRRETDSRWSALTVAVLWLAHPGVQGANFYDFHAIAFAPVLLFLTVFMWRSGRWTWFWVCVVLLLTVKEDMGFVVAALGAVLVLDGRARHGAATIAAGAVAYLALQHGVISHFSGGGHSYTWYYQQIIPEGEGPAGALATVVLNPVFALRHALAPGKTLYLLQLLAPLALLPLRTIRGVALLAYPVAASLLASRQPMFTLGFQYALVVLAPAFVGVVLALEGRSSQWRRRALAAAVMLTVITSFHYGMIWPRHNFSGGFRTIDFSFDATDRERFDEVMSCVRRIPPDAEVLASETLVPHVSRRPFVSTIRDISRDPHHPYDAVFVLKDDRSRLLGHVVNQAVRRGLVVVHDGEHCVLMLRPDA
jgi:uncharacterized membrane protein